MSKKEKKWKGYIEHLFILTLILFTDSSFMCKINLIDHISIIMTLNFKIEK